jgi:hypothetical protein
MLSVEAIGKTDGELHRVSDRPSYLRDSETQALFIFDEKALAEHESKKKKKLEEQEYRSKVDKIENDLEQVKHLLSVLINKVDDK